MRWGTRARFGVRSSIARFVRVTPKLLCSPSGLTRLRGCRALHVRRSAVAAGGIVLTVLRSRAHWRSHCALQCCASSPVRMPSWPGPQSVAVGWSIGVCFTWNAHRAGCGRIGSELSSNAMRSLSFAISARWTLTTVWSQRSANSWLRCAGLFAPSGWRKPRARSQGCLPICRIWLLAFAGAGARPTRVCLRRCRRSVPRICSSGSPVVAPIAAMCRCVGRVPMPVTASAVVSPRSSRLRLCWGLAGCLLGGLARGLCCCWMICVASWISATRLSFWNCCGLSGCKP